MVDICENIQGVNDRIAASANRAGRDPAAVDLLAVTKTQPPEVIREAIDAPHLLFGENKVQEADVKIPLLPSKAEWHLIGHLQKNKVRKALHLFPTIHSIDSLELARQVDRAADELGRFPNVYLQVNIATEASKHGFSPDRLRADLSSLLDLKRLHVLGLMLIPPFDPDPEISRPYFVHLRELRDELERTAGVSLPGLSMGMSHDFEIAIEEGATFIRVGSMLFEGLESDDDSES